MMYNNVPEQRLEPRENPNQEIIDNLVNEREELHDRIERINYELSRMGVE